MLNCQPISKLTKFSQGYHTHWNYFSKQKAFCFRVFVKGTLYSRSKGKVFYAITTKLCKTSAFVLMLTYHWSQYLCKPLRLVVQIGPKIEFGLCCYDISRYTLSFCNSWALLLSCKIFFFCFESIASFNLSMPRNLLSSRCTVKSLNFIHNYGFCCQKQTKLLVSST